MTSAFCFPLRTPRAQKPWDGEQQWCKQERGRSGSIDYYGPASWILRRKSGQLDRRAAVQLTGCFSARQREVGAPSSQRTTTVQREKQNIPVPVEVHTERRRENAFNCRSPKHLTWALAPSVRVDKDFALRSRRRLFFSHYYVMLCCLL